MYEIIWCIFKVACLSGMETCGLWSSMDEIFCFVLGFSCPQSLTHSHWIFHVSKSGSKFGEVQLRAVNQRVGKVAAAAPGTHARRLPLLAVSHHGCVVLSCRNPLRKPPKNKTNKKLVNVDKAQPLFSSYLCTRQRGHIENDISGQIFAGIHHSIGQHQPSLGISVVNLHSP